MKKIVTIVGARPQFIKAAVLSRLIRSEEWKDKFSEVLVHTGQHYDHNMSEVFFEEMEIPKPDYNLNVGSGTHGKMTGEMLIKIEEILVKEKPDVMVVYGDTNSTLAGALAASKLHIPVAHVEAGLRSYWKYMPEEQNRVLTDYLSDFLFCPTETAVDNLRKENIIQNVYQVGDIMYEANLFYLNKIKVTKDQLLRNIFYKNGINESVANNFYLLTVHRAENTDNPENFKNIVKAINEVKQDVICPLHPRAVKQMEKFGLTFESHVHVINPVGYLEILALQSACKFIVTDSGGMQKEAFFMGKKCITLREQTEWVETLENGNNVLCGTDKDKIVHELNAEKEFIYSDNPFGNGKTGNKILNKIIQHG